MLTAALENIHKKTRIHSVLDGLRGEMHDCLDIFFSAQHVMKGTGQVMALNTVPVCI